MTKKILKMYHLTPTQEGMLFYGILNPESRNYVEQVVFQLRGEINLALLHSAWALVINRHEVLRTDFLWKQIKVPVQVILNEKEAVVLTEDLQGLEAEEVTEQFNSLKEAELSKLSLPENLLNRVYFAQTSKNTGVMCWTCHHILVDGWSVSNMLQDFLNIYHHLSCGLALSAAPGAQYSDYLEWLKRQNKGTALQFWTTYLAPLETPTLLPTDLPAQKWDVVQKLRVLEGELSAETTHQLNEFCQKQNITLNALIQTAWGILLQRYNNTSVSCSGMTTSGRPLNLKNVGEIVGVLINTLPVVIRTELTESVQSLLARVNAELVEIQDYGYLALPEIQAVSKIDATQKLFDSLVVVENHPANSIQLQSAELSLTFESSFELTNYDVAVQVKSGQRFKVTLSYNEHLFNPLMMECVKENLLQTIRAIIANPEGLVQDLAVISPEERNLLLESFNATSAEYDKLKTINQLFSAAVQNWGDRLALAAGEEVLTYTQLDQRAKKLGIFLRKKGLAPNQIVGIYVERSAAQVVGGLGVLQAGGAFLPIDVDYPEARIEFMLQDSGAGLLLTEEHLREKVQGFTGEIICLKQDGYLADNAAGEMDTPLPDLNTPEDAAYVIYTSGSTGKPKGVVLEHRGIVNLQNLFRHKFAITPTDRIVQFASPAFDASVWEMFMALLQGAALYVLDRGTIDSYPKFENFLTRHEITVATLPPAYLSSLNPANISSLRLIITAGSATNHELVRRWGEKAQYINAYGPTEATICTTVWASGESGISRKIVPIGQPVCNAQVYILNERNELLPIGAAGELCIGGEGLARGYLNRLELNGEKFVPNPFSPGSRMYRSGDLARWLPDGNIEFLGRLDQQVKIRGFRIELGEIENQLLSWKEIQDAVVIAREDADGEQYLCAYLVTNGEVKLAELKNHLATHLPDYMIPAQFITLESLPLTSNGKVDVKALPVHSGSIQKAEYQPPTNPTEERLVHIWQEVFKLREIGIKDNFFSLGGHSLKAIQIAANIFKELSVEIPLRKIFAYPTIQELAVELTGEKAHTFTAIPQVAKQEYYPVSSAQKRLFAVKQFTGDSITYNIPFTWLIEGELDPVRLSEAVKTLIARHESLRTSFAVVNDVVMQKVEDEVVFTLAEFTAEEHELSAIVADFVRPFDLSKAPLIRAGLICILSDGQPGKGKHLLIMDIHHIVADGVSMDLLLKELARLYTGEKLPELRLQYKDFAVWQNELIASDKLKEQEKYWLENFHEEVPVLNLPFDYPRPAVMSFAGEAINFSLDKGLVAKFKEVSQGQGATLHMALIAVLNILFARYSGQEDITIGSPISGRPHADLQSVVGMFVNTLALRNRPEYGKRFREFLGEVKENALKAYENQDYQFEMLVEKLDLPRDVSRNPLFDVMFTFQKGIELNLELPDLRFKLREFNFQRAKFPITVNAFETAEGLFFDLEYGTKLFKRATIERMIKHFIRIVEAIVQNPEVQISAIEMILPEERAQIHEFNATRVPYPAEKSINQLFCEQVERTPEKLAVCFNGKGFTYRELNERANQLAHTLKARGVQRDEVVGILAVRSVELIVGVLAIIKAGGAYLPIDPDYPVSRIEYMLHDANVKVCLGSGAGMAGVNFAGLWLDLTDEVNYLKGKANLPDINQPMDLIYIIYTSGSTGEPKGVMVEHRNVNRLIMNSNMLVITESDRILQTGSLAFDASTFEIWGALLKGASLYLIEKAEILSADTLARSMQEYGITMIWLTAALFNQLLEENPAIFASLQILYVGGDVLSPKHINSVRAQFPQLRVINGYGPTESTTFTTYFKVEKDYTESIPIGKPVSNTQVYILDRAGNLQPVGVPGELVIAGDGLARGYLNNAGLTSQKFTPNPVNISERIYRTGDLAKWLPDGNIEFLGRIDQQVKIRGFRIELGEIEQQLLRHSEVKEAVVIDRKDIAQNKYLCAYLVLNSEVPLLSLRQHLVQTLPEAMIPAYFVKLDSIPLTANGKVDRKALPEPDASMVSGQEYVAPGNQIEARLVEIWAEILGREKISIYDSFFDLGGNSIKLISLANRIKKEFPKGIETVELFHLTTINQIAAYLAEDTATEEEIIEYVL